MAQAFILLMLLLSGTKVHAQTPKEKFLTYNLQIDRAKTAAAHDEHQVAMAIYDSAFTLIPFLGYDYYDAVLNALAADDDARANALLIQGTENGFVVEGRYNPQLQAFLLSERCMPYLNMRDYMKARWLAHADTMMIRKLNEVGSWYTIVEDRNGSVVQQQDTMAFHRLWALVRESGWPTPLSVGSDFYKAQSLLFNSMDHFPDSPKWKQVLPYIRSAMNRGALPPDYLAPFQDMADLSQGRPMTYGTLLAFYREDPSKWWLVDRATLKENRRSVGLGPIADLLFQLHLDPQLVRYAAP